MSHSFHIEQAGTALDKAKKVLIMIHGRGGSAEDILTLAKHFNVPDFALLAPQASNNTWYPFSFMAPAIENEPWLTSAIETIGATVKQAAAAGIKPEDIYFFGFSQGACLALEYTTRHAERFGGIAAITGGVIGQEINRAHYKGDFMQTPVFIGTSHPDFHVPLERVQDTVTILKDMNAAVTEKVYNNMGHTINQDELAMINKLIFN